MLKEDAFSGITKLRVSFGSGSGGTSPSREDDEAIQGVLITAKLNKQSFDCLTFRNKNNQIIVISYIW